MTVYVGGLRVRLIRESLYRAIYDALDALGWFDAGRQHSDVTFHSSSVHDSEAIPVNTAALADLDEVENEWELGSRMTEHRWTVYVDFFGENEAIATHFIHDVKDIVNGRMTAIDRNNPNFTVYDWTMATPAAIFVCEIENVMIDRPSVYDRQFQRNWFTCRFEVVDFYGTDAD